MINIHCDPSDVTTKSFIKEWENESDYITAHTSGTTGTPQIIQLSKNDMWQSAIATCKFFNISASSTMVCPLSAEYIAGKMMIVRAIVSGATLYMIKPSNNFDLPNIHQIDLLPIVPSQLDCLINKQADTTILNVLIGGAPLSTDQEASLTNCHFNPYATYGMTETCSHVALRRIDGYNTVYTALPGFSFSVDSRDCLIIENNNFAFQKLNTNDVVQLISSTSFKWLGRHDNVIITGGLKVHPEIIEKKISNILENRNFYITSKKDEKWGEKVIMVIEGDSFCTGQLQTELAKVLERHEIPREYIFLTQMPRTDSGKIKRTKYK